MRNFYPTIGLDGAVWITNQSSYKMYRHNEENQKRRDMDIGTNEISVVYRRNWRTRRKPGRSDMDQQHVVML